MIQVRQIIDVSAGVAGLRGRDLLVRDARRVVSAPRSRAMFLARRLRPEMSYPTIGRLFDGRHHTTVMNAERKIDGLLERGDNAERDAVASVLAGLGLGEDLGAAIAAAQARREVVDRRQALADRREMLLRELAQVDRQLTMLTAGAVQ